MKFTNAVLSILTAIVLVAILTIGLQMNEGSRAEASPVPVMQESFDPVDGDEEKDEPQEEEEQEMEEEEDFEDEEKDRERKEREMHFAQMEIEHKLGRLELTNRLGEIAKNDIATASYAIMQLEETMEENFEDEEQAFEFLKEMIGSDSVSKPVKNLLRMKLAEAYRWFDQPKKAMEVYKTLLQNK